MKKQLVLPKTILDIKDPVERKRAIYELAKKARVDLTEAYRQSHDTSKRSVILEQD